MKEIVGTLRSEPERYFPGSRHLGPAQVLSRESNIARTIFRVRMEGEGSKHDFFVKVFDDPRKTPEQRLAVAAAENRFHVSAQRRFAENSPFSVAPLLGPFPEQPVMVVKAVAGEQLIKLLRKTVWASRLSSGSRLDPVIARVGGWLRTFHDGSDMSERLPLVPEDVVGAVLGAFDRIRAKGFDERLRLRVENFCRRSLQQTAVRELQCVDQHNDFLPHNILIDGDRICGLDFNSVTGRGNRLVDVANFVAYLELLLKVPVASPAAVRRWQKRFLEGYRTGEWDEALLQVFVLASILRLLEVSIRYGVITTPLTVRFVRRLLRTNLGEEANGFLGYNEAKSGRGGRPRW